MKNITIGDMANALSILREKYGWDYNPPEIIILEMAIKIKKMEQNGNNKKV